MEKYTKKELIGLRKDGVPYEEAEAIQRSLIGIYATEYKPKHSKAEYYDLIISNEIGVIKERSNTDRNYTDYVYECFSVPSQHVYGFTKEHCLDQIWDAMEERKRRIAHYKTLPTLEELVDSNVKIDPKKMYYTRDRDAYEDSCDGLDGGSILEIREVGMEEYSRRCSERMIKQFDGLFKRIK